MRVTLNLELEDPHWAALAEVADRRGVKLETLLADATKRALMHVAPEWRPKRPARRRTARPTRQPGDGINPYHRDRPYDDEQIRDRILGMWRAGYSVAEISRAIGGTARAEGNRRKVGATLWDLGIDPGLRDGMPTATRSRARDRGDYGLRAAS